MRSNKPTDWRLIIVLCLPWLSLGGLVVSYWLNAATNELQAQQQSVLQKQIANALADAPPSRSAVEAALQSVQFSAAWVEDDQHARIWQRGKIHAAEHKTFSFLQPPEPAQVRWPLRSRLTLVVVGRELDPPAKTRWQTQLLIVISAIHLLVLLAIWLSYRLITQPWHQLLQFAQRLESGELDSSFNAKAIYGALAASLSSLAKRLKYARQALAEMSSTDSPDTEIEHRQQSAALAGQQQFSAMSHELRTPLTGIIGFADLLKNTALDSQQNEFVDAIRNSSNDMVEFIGDFLDKESAQAGQLELHIEALNISDLVEDTVAMMAPMAYQKNLNLLSIIDHDVPLTLEGDRKRIAQILKNLVSNAIKYTAQGHVLIRVESNASEHADIDLQISIEDTGRGLSKEQQVRLFRAFQRFESDKHAREQGTGLGLQITQELTQLLGGQISVESELDMGSKFIVRLPFKMLPASQVSSAWRALEKRRIWLFEDDETTRRSLVHLLHYWGIELEVLASIGSLKRELKDLQQRTPPELIILGLNHQRQQLESVTHVLNLSASSDIPVISLINSVDSQELKQLELLGPNKVLSKASSRSSLYRALNQALADENQSSRPLEGRKVVLAENNPASQQYLATLLSQLGAVVSAADDGEAAFLLWKRNQPDFLLLDFNMPKLDGCEVARKLRLDSGRQHTIIIGSSAYLTPAQQREWFEAGIDALLMKPFDQQQLLRCLQPWLSSAIAYSESASTNTAARLTEDPELVKLMNEELPKQLSELDDAFIEGDWERARAAAHQLHGTAAFFHLEPLKTHVFLLETKLNQEQDTGLELSARDDMAKVADAVEGIIKRLARKTL